MSKMGGGGEVWNEQWSGKMAFKRLNLKILNDQFFETIKNTNWSSEASSA